MRDEGWTLNSNTWIRPAFDSPNCLRTYFDAVNFVYRKASEGSEWHREIYLATPWTLIDNDKAREEGWQLDFMSNPAKVKRAFNLNRSMFASDEEAADFVRQQVNNGNVLAVKAALVVTRVQFHRTRMERR